MRKFVYFVGMLFTLVNVSSCMQDESIEFESDEQLKLESPDFICSRDGDCLPTVLVSGVGYLATINLTDDSFKKDHRYTFEMNGTSGSYMRERNLPANTMLSFLFPIASSDGAYTASYSITCDNCGRCSAGGSIQISKDGTIRSGTSLDCFKDYVDYSVRLGTNNSILIETSSSLPYTDPDHYMEINQMRIYQLNEYGRKGEIRHYAKLEPSSYRLTIRDLPMEINKTYQIELYNEKCKGNATHYLFLTYNTQAFNGTIHLEDYYLQLAKSH